jgi:pimeloyl-ACP methyl ester carboxylesterase
MPTLAASGETIHYVQAGSGPAVALIHSLGSNVHMWKDQIEALKSKHTVIAIDCRGHGGSSANGEASVAAAAQDLKAVLDHMGATTCHFVGIGMGGAIALSFNALWPATVRSLALADSAAEPAEGSADLVAATREALAYISMHEFGIQYAAEHLMPSTPFGVQDELANAIAKTSPKVYVETMQSALLGHFTPMLSLVKVPTLVLVGENDTDTPKSAAEYLVQNIAGASLVVIASAAHLSNLDNPTDFNSSLCRFLDARSESESR